MTDNVETRTLHDGPVNAVMQFTSISDGTGEAAVVKVDVSALAGAPSRVRILGIDYDTAGMGVDILWDASTPELAWHVPPDSADSKCFRKIGGLQDPKNSGWTGDIKFTTVGHTNGDRYSIMLRMKKKWD